jgi:hypothetical protein
MPKPETLENFYRNYRQDTDLRVTFFSPRKFARHIANLIEKRFLTPGDNVFRILDFGGADGSLSLALAEQLLESGKTAKILKSVQIDVIDYSQEPTASRHRSVSINRLLSLGRLLKLVTIW